MTKETSWKIKNMGFICALLVVSIHIDWHEDESQLLWWGSQLIKGGMGAIAGIAVPFFFVVSGYFLAAHFDEDGWWKREVGKRIKSLVVPFYLWTAISLVATIPLSIVADLIAHRPFGTNIVLSVDWLRTLGVDLSNVPMLGPLWYVRCLFLFVLISPVFKWGVRKVKWRWIATVFLVYAVSSGILGTVDVDQRTPIMKFFCYGFSLSGVFYFSTGVFIRKFGLRRLTNKQAYMMFALGLLLLIGRNTGLYFLQCKFYGIGFIIIPMLLYSIYPFMPTTPWPNWLTSCAFPIFLMHPITFQYLSIVQKYMPPMCVEAQTLIQFVWGVTVPIAVAVLLRRFFPRTASVLFGGR